MNLKEEMKYKIAGCCINDLSTQHATQLVSEIAEAYAKKKAWKCVLHFKYMSERCTTQAFNEWWEENK